MLTIVRKLRAKISELVAAHNTLNSHLRTAENGLEAKFTTLYDTAAANVETFEAELNAKFAEAQQGVDDKFDTRSAELGTQFNTLKSDQEADFLQLKATQQTDYNTLKATQQTDYNTLKSDFESGLSALQTQATNAANSASAASTSAGASAASASAAQTAAETAQDWAETAITVGDSYVASLFNTVGSATRAAITGALAALGAWFGTDPAHPNAMILPSGNASFKDVSVNSLSIAGQSVGDYFAANPRGVVDYGQSTSETGSIQAVETAVLELRTTLAKGRLYDVIVPPFLMQSSVAGDVFTVSVRAAYDGAGVSVGSTAIGTGVFVAGAANTADDVSVVIPKINSGAWSDNRQARFLISVVRTSGTGVGIVKGSATNPVVLEVRDIGAAKAPASTGPSGKLSYTSVWNCSAMYQNGAGAVVTLGNVNNDDSGNFVHALFNGNAVSGETDQTLNSLLGSIALSDITKAEIVTYAPSGQVSTYNDEAAFYIKTSTATAASASMSASQVFASTLAFPMNKAISILSALALGTRSVHFAAYPGIGGFGGDGKIVVENTVAHPLQLKLTYNK